MDATPSPLPEASPQTKRTLSPEELRQQRMIIGGLIGAAVLITALVVVSLLYMFSPAEGRAQDVERIRDVFIIFMAVESLFIGLVLIVLIVQVARLTLLLQNEIKPILDSTNQTVSTLRGTSEFLSDNLVQPVIKLNEYLAALKKLGELLGLGR